MSVLLISYDLFAKPKESYISMYETIKTADNWWHYLESVWLVSTPLTPQEWYSKLKAHITQKDRLLIIEVKPNYSGWLATEAWDWIKKHLG